MLSSTSRLGHVGAAADDVAQWSLSILHEISRDPSSHGTILVEGAADLAVLVAETKAPAASVTRVLNLTMNLLTSPRTAEEVAIIVESGLIYALLENVEVTTELIALPAINGAVEQFGTSDLFGFWAHY